jgi:hypothetical protein
MYDDGVFLFPFGIDEETYERLREKYRILSRWNITEKDHEMIKCYDKYYKKKCFFTVAKKKPIIIYDWHGGLEGYMARRYVVPFMLSSRMNSIIDNVYLVEIFPNRWSMPLFRLLIDGKRPTEVFFTDDGSVVTPDGGLYTNIYTFIQEINKKHPDIPLPDNYKIFITFDENKPYRIVRNDGLYFVIRNGKLEPHIPFTAPTTIDKIVQF